MGLTGFLEDRTPLVVGRPQAGRTDVVEARFVNAGVKHPEQRLLFFPLGHDFVVDERGEHLCLDEMGQEGEVGLWLVRQEGGLEERTHTKIKVRSYDFTTNRPIIGLIFNFRW